MKSMGEKCMTRGERFTHARESAGMSLREASAISYVAKSTIVTLESEDYSDPKYYTVAALADCYGVELRWLMEEDERKHGKWERIILDERYSKYVCSNCQAYWIEQKEKCDFSFCPSCGAEMEKET